MQTKGDPQSVVLTVRAQIQSLDPSLAVTNVQTISEIIGQGLWAPRMGAALKNMAGTTGLEPAAPAVMAERFTVFARLKFSIWASQFRRKWYAVCQSS